MRREDGPEMPILWWDVHYLGTHMRWSPSEVRDLSVRQRWFHVAILRDMQKKEQARIDAANSNSKR